jgi:antitoxin component of MazEF toxin-antitoxin module
MILFKIFYRRKWKKMPHEYKVRRKLQEQGGSYFVFLPKIWVESLGLEKGDLMSVEFNGIVKVKPPSKRSTTKKEG